MKTIEIQENIELFQADALVYSTNQNLYLSGGVGACLVKKYGHEVQEILDSYLREVDGEIVEVGTIVEGKLGAMPWKRVFHTVATDLNYDTNAAVVSKIIEEVLERCELDYSINSIVFSALGAGYGSLDYKKFVVLLNEKLKDYSSETFKVYVANKKF